MIFIGEVLGFWGTVLVIEGVSNLLRGRRNVRKDAFSCQTGASAGEGAPYLLRRVTSWTKRARSLIRRAHSLAERRTHNAFGAKADPGLS